jgi:hypothetical protein
LRRRRLDLVVRVEVEHRLALSTGADRNAALLNPGVEPGLDLLATGRKAASAYVRQGTDARIPPH